MKAEEQRQKAKELHLVESALRGLADYLEHLPTRKRELSARQDRGLSVLHRKIHESKIEEGELLDKAVALDGFESKRGSRQQLASRRLRVNPHYGHSSAFEYACLKWIPKQADGFDFTWKRKQVGDVGAYALALCYLADCLVKPDPSERKTSSLS